MNVEAHKKTGAITTPVLFDDLVEGRIECLDNLTDFLGIERFSNTVKFPHTNRYSKPGLRDDTRAYLARLFRKDVEELGSYLGRDLSHWLV